MKLSVFRMPANPFQNQAQRVPGGRTTGHKSRKGLRTRLFERRRLGLEALESRELMATFASLPATSDLVFDPTPNNSTSGDEVIVGSLLSERVSPTQLQLTYTISSAHQLAYDLRSVNAQINDGALGSASVVLAENTDSYVQTFPLSASDGVDHIKASVNISFRDLSALQAQLPTLGSTRVHPAKLEPKAYFDVTNVSGGIPSATNVGTDTVTLSALSVPWDTGDTVRVFMSSVPGAVPTSTDTAADSVTFAVPHGLATGNAVRVSQTGSGLTSNVSYFVNVTSPTSFRIYSTASNASVGGTTGRVDLTGDVTSGFLGLNPTGLIRGPILSQSNSSAVHFVRATGGNGYQFYDSRANALAGGSTGRVDIIGSVPTDGQVVVLGERNDLAMFGQVPSATTGNQLTFPAPHGFVTGDTVQVSASASGVSSTTLYYASVVDDTTIRLHSTLPAALNGTTPIAFSSPVTSVISRVTPGWCWDADREVAAGQEYYVQFWSTYQTSLFPDTTRQTKLFSPQETGVVLANNALSPNTTNTTSDQITFQSAHGLTTGDPVAVTLPVDSLTPGTVYYVRAVSSGTVALYDTAANAQAGGTTGLVDLTESLAGKTTFYRTQQIKLNSSSLNLLTGNRVVFDQTVGGLVADQVYFVNRINSTTMSLHTSRADAVAGLNPISLTDLLPLSIKVAIWEHLVEHPENMDAVNWLVNYQAQGRLANGITPLSTTTANGNVQPTATDFTTNETITLPAGHGFFGGDVVTVTSNGGGLSVSTTYYLNQVSGNTFSIHTGVPTVANRVNLTAAITARLTGNVINLPAANWSNGQAVQVSATGGGLTAGVDYHIRAFSSDVIGFYASAADANNDTNRINLTGPITAQVQAYFTTLEVQDTIWELLENAPKVNNPDARVRINQLIALTASNVPLYQESVDYLPPAGGSYSILSRPTQYNEASGAFESTGQLSISLYPARLIPGYAITSQTIVDQGITTLLAGLGDFVWEDLNKNGLQDAGEPGIANVVVRLLDPNDNVLDTTTTNGTGNYQFLDLNPGSYKVQFVTPSDFTPTVSNAGNDALDSDPINGITGSYTLVGGQFDPTVDAGFYRSGQLLVTSFADYGTGPCVANPAVIPAGNSLGYRIVITNQGTTVARGVKLNNVLPGGPTLPPGSGLDWMIDTSTGGSASGTAPSKFRLSGPVGQEVLTFSNQFNGVLQPGQSISVRVYAKPTNLDALRGTPYGKAFDTTGTRAANLISLGAATDFLTFGMNGSTVNANTAYVQGSLGIGSGGTINSTNGSIVVTNVLQHTAGQFVGSDDTQVRGNVVTSSTISSQANADLVTAATSAKGFKSDFQFGSITGPTTIRVTNGSRADGVTVVNVAGDINLAAAELTLVGNPTDVVIINVAGNMNLTGPGSGLRVSGGLTANHVLYNLTGSSATFTADNRSRVTGTVLGPQASVSSQAQTVGAYFAGGSTVNLNSARISMGTTIFNNPMVTSTNAGSTSTTGTVVLEPTDLSNWMPLTAAGRSAAAAAVDYGLLDNPFPLMLGERTVALVGDWSGAGGEYQARVRDAVSTLNTQLAAMGVHLTLQTNSRAAADFYLNLATSSSIGNRGTGLLGATNGSSATLIRDWNWYTGANARGVTAGRYDFQSAVTHELAHLIGLGHSLDQSSVLYRELAVGKAQRQLSARDLAQLSSVRGPSTRAIDQLFASGGF